MPTIAHPVTDFYTLKTASVVFKLDGATDSDDFSDHIGEIAFNPASQTGSWTSINGKVVSENGIATWTATMGLVQDLNDQSFLLWLLEHEGEKASVTATLKSGTGAFTFDVTLTPAQIGGQVGSNPLSSQVTLPMDGKPVKA